MRMIRFYSRAYLDSAFYSMAQQPMPLPQTSCHHGSMPRDPNELAFQVFQEAIGKLTAPAREGRRTPPPSPGEGRRSQGRSSARREDDGGAAGGGRPGKPPGRIGKSQVASAASSGNSAFGNLGLSNSMTPLLGHITNDLIYDRMAPGV